DDIGPGLKVLAVDLIDDVGPHQRQQLVVALEVLAMFGETLPAEVGFAELVSLDHGAHGAVQDQDALLQQADEVAAAGIGRWRIRQAGMRHGNSRKYVAKKATNA